MQEIRVKVNQIEMQIREYEHEGDAVIFLHFSGANLEMWQRAIPHFQDQYHLILVDLRGHGKSDRPETGYHMDDMARDVIGVMQHLKLERAHIVGSSLGAEVGLAMAANYPDKVISLVCDGALYSEYGPFGIWEGSEADFEKYVASQLDKMQNAPDAIYPSVEALVDDRRTMFEKYGWWNEYVEAMVRYDARKIDEGKYMRGMGKQAHVDYMRHYFHYRFEDYYKKVTCRILMLAEKELEEEQEKAAMQKLQKLAEQAQIVNVSGWAHPYCWLLDPEEASKVVLEFLLQNTEAPEPMAAFFDARSKGYDDYIRNYIFSGTAFTQLYQALVSPIEKTDEPVNILDLGCGTGLEIEALLARAPNALLTGVDVAKNMLEQLRDRYVDHMSRITLVADSYLTTPFGMQAYDYIISAMSMHHLLPDTKRELYTKIRSALKPGGKYIEGDSVIPAEMENEFLTEYHEQMATVPPAQDGYYHIDIPFSIDMQKSLLLEAGFKDFQLVWQRDHTMVWNTAVYVVTA